MSNKPIPEDIKKKSPIVVGDVTPPEAEKLIEEEVPTEVTEKIPRLVEYVKLASKHTGKSIAEVIDMLAHDPKGFRLIVRESVGNIEETYRLLTLANYAYRIKEGIKLKLKGSSINQVFPLPVGTTSLRPIESLDPKKWEDEIKEYSLEAELKKVIEGI